MSRSYSRPIKSEPLEEKPDVTVFKLTRERHCTDKAERFIPQCSSSQTGVCFTTTTRRVGSTRLLGPSPRGSDSVALGRCCSPAFSLVPGLHFEKWGSGGSVCLTRVPRHIWQLPPLSLVPLPLQTSLKFSENFSLYQPLERLFPLSSHTAMSTSCIFPCP